MWLTTRYEAIALQLTRLLSSNDCGRVLSAVSDTTCTLVLATHCTGDADTTGTVVLATRCTGDATDAADDNTATVDTDLKTVTSNLGNCHFEKKPVFRRFRNEGYQHRFAPQSVTQ